MALFDVFNGDADGICAVQQWRLAHPGESELVTGVKRDIGLLKRVSGAIGDQVAVFDISLDKNRDALLALLEQGVQIVYFDHHFPGDIPEHPRFTAHIDTSAEVCTSLLVNHQLGGKYLGWAVVGAFGDNLVSCARNLAHQLGLDETQVEQLKTLGECMNYNAYGASLDDLHITPDDLCRAIRPYQNPLDFIDQQAEIYQRLMEGYQQDFSQASRLDAYIGNEHIAVYLLPNQPWARRVSGVFANELAKNEPGRAHALLTARDDGDYLVSVRAPLTRKEGADTLCMQFPTGGGRKAAAGINQLPADLLDKFIEQFRFTYPGY